MCCTDKLEMSERERIQFIEKRDGKESAKEFAKRGITVYTNALKTPYGKAFKEQLEVSINVYKKYLGES